MYAIIKTGGKQYKVAPGDVIQVEKLEGAQGSVVEFAALAVGGEGGEGAALRSGKEANARVTGTIVGNGRGKKVLVFKFRRKKHYKRLTGHRQALTRVKISEIVG